MNLPSEHLHGVVDGILQGVGRSLDVHIFTRNLDFIGNFDVSLGIPLRL